MSDLEILTWYDLSISLSIDTNQLETVDRISFGTFYAHKVLNFGPPCYIGFVPTNPPRYIVLCLFLWRAPDNLLESTYVLAVPYSMMLPELPDGTFRIIYFIKISKYSYVIYVGTYLPSLTYAKNHTIIFLNKISKKKLYFCT